MFIKCKIALYYTHIRSSSSLRKAPKRHFTNVSLAVATLGADENSLLNDLNFMGFLFESLVTHELRVYAQANDALLKKRNFIGIIRRLLKKYPEMSIKLIE